MNLAQDILTATPRMVPVKAVCDALALLRSALYRCKAAPAPAPAHTG